MDLEQVKLELATSDLKADLLAIAPWDPCFLKHKKKIKVYMLGVEMIRVINTDS